MTDSTPAPAPAPAAAPRIRLLLVDDQQLIRLGMRMVLEADPGFEVVGEAGDGHEALAAVARLRPDVVLMDVRMPGMDGIEATRRVVEAHPESRIIILTTFDLDEYAFAGLNAGASGFLLKDAQPAELAAAIRAVASGDAAVSPRVTRKLLELFGPQLPSGAPGGAAADTAPAPDQRFASLTERERDVLVAMAEGLTNTEIAARFYLSESTVKTHVGRVLLKLELRDRVQAVIYAYGAGLV
ncbi:response regulator transcription factor [Herbiconiux sp. CPCC 203407]|uniref:Response regulator transcription factor n=1 Tax=Herbiconiux oxytropis TaxID=2970915 RepID=A0AA41XJ65_9MICO|nr:response regulator transcription factor [Herbiconiux oxytropis]MCS5722287.1 response regulator transcription factor [Herbiconiux oxytropis]MCS5727075.1 response regulator transcription factor [Herbiconiux oxytropis]